MSVICEVIEYIFSIVLFINALLSIPQIGIIIGERNITGISSTAFLSLLLVQISVVSHKILIIGYGLNVITNIIFTIMVIQYKHFSYTLSLD